MKTKILIIIGIGLLVFGFVNVFAYFSEFGLINTPFPFDNITSMNSANDSDGIVIITESNHSVMSAVQIAPFWFFWSASLYAGIGITGLSILFRRKRK